MNSSHGKDVARLSSKTYTGKKDDTNIQVNKVIEKGKELDEMFNDKKYNKASDKGQAIANDFYKKLGYGEKPEILSKDEYSKELKNNNLGELCRGINATDAEMNSYLKQYKEGDLHTSGSINSMFGRGIYFGVGKDAESIAESYGNHVMKCMIKNDSKIITIDELSVKRKAILNNITNRRDKGIEKSFKDNNRNLYTKSTDLYKKSMPIIADNGYLAAILGYDAVIDKGQGVLVILNRKKMIFSD